MKLSIILCIFVSIFCGCLSRANTSHTGNLDSIPSNILSKYSPEDLDNNGIPDGLDEEIRERYGLGPDEPTDEYLEKYLNELENSVSHEGAWTADETAETIGLTTDLLASFTDSLLDYWATKNTNQAAIEQARIENQQGTITSSIKPLYNPGNVEASDYEYDSEMTSSRVDGRYYAMSGYYKYNGVSDTYVDLKPKSSDNVGTFVWKTSSSEIEGGFSIIPYSADKPKAGVIQIFNAVDDSGNFFNGYYTLEVGRCCKYKKDSVNGFFSYDIVSNFSPNNLATNEKIYIDNYRVYKICLYGQSESTGVSGCYEIADGASESNCPICM